MDQTTILILVAIVVVVLVALLWLLRGRRQHVAFDATAPLPRRSEPAPAPAAPAPPRIVPAPAAEPEGHGIGSEVTAAIEDVVDQFVGIDAHPSGAAADSRDTLTLLKGLGPKAAARLEDLGVTRFAQIAAWDESDVAAIDAQMGAFRGRIARDRWVEQARLLAAGDRDGFETAFGKIGG